MPTDSKNPETGRSLSVATGSAGVMAERNLGLVRLHVNPRSMSAPNTYGMVEINITIRQARELRIQIMRAIRGKPNTKVTQ